MPHPVYSHLFGTVALIGIMVAVGAFVHAVATQAYFDTQRARLAEVAESVAREVVEIASLHTLGEGGFTYMDLHLPQTVGGDAYTVRLVEVEENRVAVIAELQYGYAIRVIVVPNFGSGALRVLEGELELGGFVFSDALRVPCERPVVAVISMGGEYYVALGREA
ncbi:MAG: hypothetical protein DRJ56_06485 [Thermoprotei archaeon]|nr:MAG: hypothetical protein DRJ56_06485 [Thermoprotei archaeon]